MVSSESNMHACTVLADQVQENLTMSFCLKNGVVYRLSMAMCSILFPGKPLMLKILLLLEVVTFY